MIRGVPISPGVAVARAFRMDPALARHTPSLLDAAALSAEVVRFDQACDAVAAELDKTIERVRQEVGEDSADIFRGHRAILRDPAFVAKVKSYILNGQLDAATSLNKTLEEYDVLFARIRDDYLRERMADIRDVAEQIMAQVLVERDREAIGPSEPLVLVAPEIRPSQAAMFDKLPVSAIATEAGGSTGHAAVLARGLGIPAVSGLAGLMGQVHNGDLIIVDGREGIVIVNPGPEVEAAYRKLQREYRGPARFLGGKSGLAVDHAGWRTRRTFGQRQHRHRRGGGHGGRRFGRRLVPHRIRLPDASHGADRRGASRCLSQGDRRGAQSFGGGSHARPRRRQASQVFQPLSPDQSVHGLAQHPNEFRTSGVFPDPIARDPAGRRRRNDRHSLPHD